MRYENGMDMTFTWIAVVPLALVALYFWRKSKWQSAWLREKLSALELCTQGTEATIEAFNRSSKYFKVTRRVVVLGYGRNRSMEYEFNIEEVNS